MINSSIKQLSKAVVQSGSPCFKEECACLCSGLARDDSAGVEMSSSDGMAIKGKCQGESGGSTGLERLCMFDIA